MYLFCFFQTLSLGTILISICHTILKPVKNSIMRKGKKKKEPVPNVTVSKVSICIISI